MYMNYCKLHFLFIFVHVDLKINFIDWLNLDDANALIDNNYTISLNRID